MSRSVSDDRALPYQRSSSKSGVAPFVIALTSTTNCRTRASVTVASVCSVVTVAVCEPDVLTWTVTDYAICSRPFVGSASHVNVSPFASVTSLP